ncbi:ABC transporter permease subunit [Bordetella petrii]|nr:ABC transporter permease subunit [Bordetella petrii]
MSATTNLAAIAPMRRTWMPRFLRGRPALVGGAALLIVLVAIAVASPWLTGNPQAISPLNRLRPPSADLWFGADQLGRDIYARTLQGARVSLLVGVCVALLSAAIGLLVGVLCGFYRRLDAVVMRLMDALMAIPSILLAIALTTLVRGGVLLVIVAITVPEIPRVVRLVRSVVLTLRGQPYVIAAIAAGTRQPLIMLRHIVPNAVSPLIVQATYVCASAILTEAGLSFIGAGVPPEVPSWGNIIASARSYFQIAPWAIFFPGVGLALTVLAVNLLGDGLRDSLDPRASRRL